MSRYLDPKNDLIFKRIFGENPDLLLNFLNALMPLPADCQIEELNYLPAEQVPDTPVKKDSIVDVKCKDNNGRVFIVEMQMYWFEAFTNRVIFNAGKAYVRQLDKGNDYDLLHPVYSLAILNENFDDKTEQFYHHYSIVNRENTDEVMEGLEFVLVELKKFKPETWSERRMAVLWLRFLKEVNERMSTLPAELKDDNLINKAAELCEKAALTEAQLAVYDAYWDQVSLQKSVRGEAKRAQAKLEASQAKLEASQAKLEASQAKFKASQAKFKASQDENVVLQTKLEASQAERHLLLARIAEYEHQNSKQ